MLIFLLGLPASGKGQLCQNARSQYNIPSYSIGEVIRQSDNEDLKTKMQTGQLLDDDIIIQITKDKIEEIKKTQAAHSIIDGFPRTIKQTKAIIDYPNAIFISLKCSVDILRTRICNRIMCGNCKTIFNSHYQPDIKECTNCGSNKFVKRPDDSEEIFENRMKSQKPAHDEIVEYLGNRARTINSEGDEKEILDKFLQIIREYA